jgi:hypothetical protein
MTHICLLNQSVGIFFTSWVRCSCCKNRAWTYKLVIYIIYIYIYEIMLYHSDKGTKIFIIFSNWLENRRQNHWGFKKHANAAMLFVTFTFASQSWWKLWNLHWWYSKSVTWTDSFKQFIGPRPEEFLSTRPTRPSLFDNPVTTVRYTHLHSADWLTFHVTDTIEFQNLPSQM